ncbi:hypothetical protein KNP414_03456 [Paenibacillus mucilaginosus KNP414]|uniref:Uncharacterized protein n=1 Tax=Paenibacillus mucilaginosus (strain KNP414) TaxID=1036673 RepID=F8F8V2_PAEMK|nr:hypothetical protein KNP414_03456 [Paenibacillus mucilaginosus KNP414]
MVEVQGDAVRLDRVIPLFSVYGFFPAGMIWIFVFAYRKF